MHNAILPLNTTGAGLDTVGGKALSLMNLVTAGFSVPAGFCVTTYAYRRFIDDNGLRNRIIELARPRLVDRAMTFEPASKEIQTLFEADMSREIRSEIVSAYTGMEAVAVRSSATAEDLPDLSFAGQQNTYLNVDGDDRVVAAVKNCWASLWSERAIAYRHEKGIPQDDVAMAVVVQSMVPSEMSGVLFTANPVTGERSELVVNSSFGLGEAVVSGRVTPDTYVVDRSSLAVKETMIGTKELMIVGGGADGVATESVPETQREASSLNEELLKKLAQTALEIERLNSGLPQDIEWAVSEGRVWLLQSRPITKVPPQPIEVSWALPADLDPAVDVLMRRQILENVPDPVSPLFEDLYLKTGIKKVRMLNGFAYMPFRRTTSTSTRRAKRSADGNSQKTSIEMAAKERHDMEKFVAELSIDDLARFTRFTRFNTVSGELNSESLAHLITNPDDPKWNLRLVTENLDPMVEGFHVARKPAYLAKIAEWRDIEKSTASDEQLLAGMRELAAVEASYWFDGPKAKGVGLGGRTRQSNSLTLAISKVTDRQLQVFLDQHLPGFTSGHFLTGFKSRPMQATYDAYEIAKLIRADDELYELVVASPVSRLMSALRIHPSSGPVVNAIDEYLDTYGHHSPTLDFVEPTLREDPTPLFVTLRNMVVDPDYDPRHHEVVAERKREAALKEVERCLEGSAYWQFRFRLWFASRYYPVREEVTFYLGSAWPVLRSIALELGGRLVEAGTLASADDVFYLDGTELRDALGAPESQKSSPYRRLTVHRRDLREARKRAHPPGTIPPEARQDAVVRGIETQTYNDPASATLKGVPVSAGSVTGVASVIRSAAEFDQMKPGSILVCAMTNPAWTPLFAHAKGLVTDIGGILAHGSIVAREYGIPAVLGTGNITERVKSGDSITVDGDKGTVTVHSLPAESLFGILRTV